MESLCSNFFRIDKVDGLPSFDIRLFGSQPVCIPTQERGNEEKRKETGEHEGGSEDFLLALCSQAFINQTFIRNTHTVMESDNLFH